MLQVSQAFNKNLSYSYLSPYKLFIRSYWEQHERQIITILNLEQLLDPKLFRMQSRTTKFFFFDRHSPRESRKKFSSCSVFREYCAYFFWLFLKFSYKDNLQDKKSATPNDFWNITILKIFMLCGTVDAQLVDRWCEVWVQSVCKWEMSNL